MITGSTRTANRYVALAMGLLAIMATVGIVGYNNALASYPTNPTTAQPTGPTGKVDPEVLEDTANGKSTDFLVLMSQQANLTKAYGMRDHDARGWYVFNTLISHADTTQAALRAMLTASGRQYRVYWISNALYVYGDRALVDTIAARSDVARIVNNRPFPAIDPIVEASSDSPDAIEWGVQNVRAPEVWALGFRGQGIVVGNGDTGMRWTHTAIKNQYRGWDGTAATHPYNWYDGIRVPSPGNPCGIMPSPEPCDDDELLGGGHGTHTTGSAVGWDGGTNEIGVAPLAKWIGCRNLDRGLGYPTSYLNCFQFFLAPHDLNGQNPNPALRPHVENNSWACVEGCAGDVLKPAVENSQAAGILIEVSAGNDGPACSTIAWEPQIFEASFDTGAINISNQLANFSSRGPVARDGSMRLKPNVSAPGVGVRSSLRATDTTYGSLSGTSMAGPHTVGVVALLWSARPDLARQITETKQLIQMSANPNVAVPNPQNPHCGNTPPSQIPNNYFGWGRVDALAAVQRANATVTPVTTATAPAQTATATRTATAVSTATGTPCPPTGTTDVGIANFFFSPQVVTITIGSSVRWTNNQGSHSSTSDTSVWDSGVLAVGQSFTFTFNTPGVYSYHCSVHPTMTGTVNVTGGCPITPTPTMPVQTATATRTATAVMGTTTPSPAPPTPTTTCCLGTVGITGTTSCSPPSIYSYEFDIHNGCSNRAVCGPTTFFFEVSENQNGPWTLQDQQSGSNVCIGAGQHAIVNGSFNASAVPPQYQWYRVRMTYSWVDCQGGHNTPGFTPSGPLFAADYAVSSSAGATMVPANNRVPGSGCSDCTVNIALPFSYNLYSVTYNFVSWSSEGNLQFASANASGANTCLPAPALNYPILAYWDDLNAFVDDTMGAYTATTGTAPNRIFAIRVHEGRIAADSIFDYQVLLYEGRERFDIIYGTLHEQGNSATVGVQKGTGERFTQHSCNNLGSVQQGMRLTFNRRTCP